MRTASAKAAIGAHSNHSTADSSLGGDGESASVPSGASTRVSQARGPLRQPGSAGKGYDVFIRNLPEDATSKQLAEFFGAAGKIVRAPRLNLGRGFAWITFNSMDAVAEAVRWSGSHFGSRILYVHPANNVSPSDAKMHGCSGTDIGAHIPALRDETVEKLVAPSPGATFVDGTFGRGGHSKAMLAAMAPSGKLHAFDMDPEAIKEGERLMAEDARFTIHHAPFSSMHKVLKPLGVTPGSVDGVLLDVGISSPQFDDASRGFRPETDGPLDLRFDPSKGVPASAFLQTVPHEELVRIIDAYGEESGGGHAARRIADAICLARSRGELPSTTRSFAELVARAKGKESSGQVMHPAKMTFQALRIHLNSEFDEMRKGVRAAFKLVREGGRIGLITWKFSERKIVDDVFGSLVAVRPNEPLREWYQQQPGASPLPNGPSLESDDVVRPSERELQRNSRCRQALLHVLRKRNLPRLAHLEKRAYRMPGWAAATAPTPAATVAKEKPGGKRQRQAANLGDEKMKPKKKAAKKVKLASEKI
mmetsp:Transcript_9200/g.21345  ORF Transcript_9200/g.21345 Transcript_9200/m.21345 type:complete len:535 (-) Transcript_9200:208-1812(-)